MNWFLDDVSHKSHVKFENLEKPRATNKRFKQHVFGKPKVSLAHILKYLVNITLYYT